MTILLKAMRKIAPAGRDEVMVPSYTCYSVAASVIKAGLRVRIVDISPETLDYAPDAMADTDFSKVLAVVATNLYGMPSDLPRLSRIASAHGAFLIDDAAQAMGASVGGRPCGTSGDAGLYSFDKGKNVAAIDGGVVVTSSPELAVALRGEVVGLPGPSGATATAHVAKAILYAAMLRPWLYALPASVPQLGLGRTVFTTEFPLAQADPRLVTLARTMMERLDVFTQARVGNARALLDGLRAEPSFRTISELEGSTPVYLRLPILLPTREARDQAIQQLNRGGIGATGSYPASLADIEPLRHAVANPGAAVAGGRQVAATIATLPTHPFVSTGDIERTLSILGRIVGRSAAARDKAAIPPVVAPRPH